jgi:hypothetical protein
MTSLIITTTTMWVLTLVLAITARRRTSQGIFRGITLTSANMLRFWKPASRSASSCSCAS